MVVYFPKIYMSDLKKKSLSLFFVIHVNGKMETSHNLTKYLLVFATLILFTRASSIYQQYQIAYTQDGAVRGHLNHSLFFYTPYYSFRGVPFATPPIGQLRFKVRTAIKTHANL